MHWLTGKRSYNLRWSGEQAKYKNKKEQDLRADAKRNTGVLASLFGQIHMVKKYTNCE